MNCFSLGTLGPHTQSFSMKLSLPDQIKGASQIPGLFSLIALGVSVFFAGQFLEGERLQKRELKTNLQEIEATTQQILQQVDSINQAVAAQDAALSQKIASSYALLGELGEKKQKQRLRLIRRNRNIAQNEANRERDKQEMRQAGGFKFRK